MKVHAYTVTHDTGFAPNPFWGYCSLACCKLVIRRTAEVGDWVVGLTPKAEGDRMVFAMRVDQILTFEAYYQDGRFAAKIPDYSTRRIVNGCGDNIYKPLPTGGFRQLRSMHSNGEDEDPQTKDHDLGGKNVLISRTFHYFGSHSPRLPEALLALRGGRGHKNRFSELVISEVMQFLGVYRTGVHGNPTEWQAAEDCLEEGSCRGTLDYWRMEVPRERADAPHPCEPQRRSARTGPCRRDQ
jgi:hypothetical protein